MEGLKTCNLKFIFAIISASFGSAFHHGFHTGVVNVAEKAIKGWIIENRTNRTGKYPSDYYITFIWSATVGMFPIGGFCGIIMTNYFAARFGRKGGLLWNNIISFLATVFLTSARMSKLFEVFMIGRFLCGVNAGLNSGLCPIYLVEIAPVAVRGSTGSFYGLMFSLSIFVSNICSFILGTEEYWPFIFILGAIPAAFQMVALRLCPESPIYLLITKGDVEQARKALLWFRNSDIQHEIETLEKHALLLKALPKISVTAMFTDSFYRTPWIISIVTVLGQQLCGIDAIIYYSTIILRNAGFSGYTPMHVTVIMGTFMLCTTVIFVFAIELIGRRRMLLVSFFGMCFETVFILVIMYLSLDPEIKVYLKYGAIIGIIGFSVMYACGVNSVPFIMPSEFFPHSARPLAMSMTYSFNWIANIAVSLSFLHLTETIGPFVFGIFAFLDVIFFFFIYTYVPETSGKTPTEIMENFFVFK